MSGPDNPWHHLGIAPTADESAIRRAYAKRLRQVRPDVDPAAFQRLVEARDYALRWAQYDSNAVRWQLPGDQVVAVTACAEVVF